MADRIRSKITVIGRDGRETKDVTIYLPFPDAAFAVQRHLSLKDWMIVHVATSAIVPHPCPYFETLDEGLVIARRLSVDCPSASQIHLVGGKVTGPVKKLGEEVRASVGA